MGRVESPFYAPCPVCGCDIDPGEPVHEDDTGDRLIWVHDACEPLPDLDGDR